MVETVSNRMSADERRFLRVPFSTRVEYFHGAGASGTGCCREVSHRGLSMRLGRYLAPGRKVLVRVFSVANPVEAAELKGRVAWCRPTAAPDQFLAGIEVFFDAPEAFEDLSRLVLEAALAHTWSAVPQTGEQPRETPDRARWGIRRTAEALAHAGFAKTLALATAMEAVQSGSM